MQDMSNRYNAKLRASKQTPELKVAARQSGARSAAEVFSDCATDIPQNTRASNCQKAHDLTESLPFFAAAATASPVEADLTRFLEAAVSLVTIPHTELLEVHGGKFTWIAGDTLSVLQSTCAEASSVIDFSDHYDIVIGGFKCHLQRALSVLQTSPVSFAVLSGNAKSFNLIVLDEDGASQQGKALIEVFQRSTRFTSAAYPTPVPTAVLAPRSTDVSRSASSLGSALSASDRDAFIDGLPVSYFNFQCGFVFCCLF
jgi:hypothetical protein